MPKVSKTIIHKRAVIRGATGEPIPETLSDMLNSKKRLKHRKSNMRYNIRAYRRARKKGVLCDVVTAFATADTPERAEAIRKEFAEGHPDCEVEVTEA